MINYIQLFRILRIIAIPLYIFSMVVDNIFDSVYYIVNGKKQCFEEEDEL
jgi:hypothetical protein